MYDVIAIQSGANAVCLNEHQPDEAHRCANDMSPETIKVACSNCNLRELCMPVGFDAKAPVRDEANVLLDERDLAMLLPLLGLSPR